MAIALLGVRLLLALVFVAAGVGKLRDRRGFSRTLVAFGAPRAVVALGTTLIPLMELVVGLSLLPAAYARWGAIASVMLLAVFTSATSLAVFQGRSPDCACFGSSAAEPIGPATLVRNGALVALALFVLLAGPGGGLTSTASAWTDSPPNERTLGTGALVLLFALGGLSLHASRLRASNLTLVSRVTALESQRRAQPAAHALDLGAGGLPAGAAAPEFDLPRLEGDRASLASLMKGGRPVALIFLSAHCPACHELWPDIERWQARDAHQVTVAEVCSGSAQTIELKLMGYSATNVLLEGDAQVAEAYALSLRPSAVIVGSTGLIDSGSVAGVAAIRALVAERIRSFT
jgi:uncharacterized membrane protein YphA (DoxX/SURF4 family)